MNTKSFDILKIIYYIGIVLTFFMMFVVYLVPKTLANLYVGFFFWVGLYLLCFLQNRERFLKFLLKILKNKISKILGLYLGFIFLTSIIHFFLGRYLAGFEVYIFRIYNFLIAVLLVYFLPVLAIYLKINIKYVIKLLYLTVFFIFIAGIIQFFAFVFHIRPIQEVFYFFTNARTVLHWNNWTDSEESYRVFSIFCEPGVLGKFCFIILPFAINLTKSKFKLYKNMFLNLLVKKTFLMLLFINLFLTLSPIWIIATLAEFGFFMFLYIITNKKHAIVFSSILLLIFLLGISFTNTAMIESLNSSDNVILSRILVTFENFSSLGSLSITEPSLAMRVLSINLQIKVFLHNILFGVGFANMPVGVNSFAKSLDIILPKEFIYNYYLKPHSTLAGPSIVFTHLAELGIIGFSLYMVFIWKHVIDLFKISKKITGVLQFFAISTYQSIIAIFIYSFYTSYLETVGIWFIYGLGFYIINHYKYVICKSYYIKENQEISDGREENT